MKMIVTTPVTAQMIFCIHIAAATAAVVALNPGSNEAINSGRIQQGGKKKLQVLLC